MSMIVITRNERVLGCLGFIGRPLFISMNRLLAFKDINSIEVTNQYPGGYWEDLGYNWFAGGIAREGTICAIAGLSVSRGGIRPEKFRRALHPPLLPS
jgi:hypothetical protein